MDNIIEPVDNLNDLMSRVYCEPNENSKEILELYSKNERKNKKRNSSTLLFSRSTFNDKKSSNYFKQPKFQENFQQTMVDDANLENEDFNYSEGIKNNIEGSTIIIGE